jgi:O-antigen ligase/tetratricopeptide (TPR) repeat protein
VAKKRKKVQSTALKVPLGSLSYYLTLSILVLVPLAFSPFIYTKYSLPKFVVLLVGAAGLFLVLTIERSRASQPSKPILFRSVLVRFVSLYFLIVLVSTIFGVNPVGSIFGSSYNHMGLLTLICAFVVFLGVIHGVGSDERRLRALLYSIGGTGLLVAIYALVQSLGYEPFVSRAIYTFGSPEGSLVRVCSTLGHSDYLGNFLLYTTLTTAAMGFAARGLVRYAAFAATLVSIAAIAFSGVRGAWIGLAAGLVVFALLEIKSAKATGLLSKGRMVIGAAAVIGLAAIIVLSPASRSVAVRAKALVTEGTSSSGRIVLWRDSLRMVSNFPIVGTGPEGFRKASLAFKSDELNKLSQKANNENPHNSYLSAAIAYGLPGAAVYLVIIVLGLRLLFLAKRQAAGEVWPIVTTGLFASFVAVLVHNIFIFDQVTTVLYFFAFLAIAHATKSVVDARNASAAEVAARKNDGTQKAEVGAGSLRRPSGLRPVFIGVAAICVVASLWYSVGLVSADSAYKDLLNPANPVDYDKLTKFGERITASPLPTGAYDYLFARAVDLFVTKLPAASQQAANGGMDVNEVRTKALALGISHVEKSLDYTFTPDINYSLLAKLARAAGDVTKLRKAAMAAVQADPKNYYTRWLKAESYLVAGDRDRAAEEAEVALRLYPASMEAASTLARARGYGSADDAAQILLAAEARSKGDLKKSIDDLVSIGRELARAGKLGKARVKLVTAIYRSNGSCVDCHRELALVYEKMGRYDSSILEWELFIKLCSDREPVEQAKAHLDELRRKRG